MPDPLDTPIRERLELFADLVRSSDHNLVSRRAREELETRHVPECVALAAMLPSEPHRLLDVGSGGGFPGLIIAIVRPDIEVHLLDATAKKTAFLREAARDIGVSPTVHTGRAEELQRGPLGGAFDVVTARAVAAMDRLVGWTLPFLRRGGVLYAVKGERWREELEEARYAIERHAGAVVATPDDTHSAEITAGEERPRVVMLSRVG